MSREFLVVEDPADVPESVRAFRALGYAVVRGAVPAVKGAPHPVCSWRVGRPGSSYPVGMVVPAGETVGVPDCRMSDAGGDQEVFGELRAWKLRQRESREVRIEFGAVTTVTMRDGRIEVTGTGLPDPVEGRSGLSEAFLRALLALADRLDKPVASQLEI